MGAGSRSAIPGILGMLFGAGLYAETYPFWKTTVLKPMSLGKITLPEVTGIPALAWMALLAVAFALFFAWLARRKPNTA